MSPQDAETIRDVFAKIRSMGTGVDDAAAARLVEQEVNRKWSIWPIFST